MSQEAMLAKQLRAALGIITELNAIIVGLLPNVDVDKMSLDEAKDVTARIQKCQKIVADILAELARI